MEKVKIIQLSGLPGIGKSTYAEKLSKEINAVIVCADTIRGELSNPPGDETDQSQNYKIFCYIIPDRVRKAIVQGKNVIIDTTSPSKKERKTSIELGLELGVEVECHFFLPDLAKAKKQNKMRKRQVPEFVYDKMMSKWLQANVEEGFSLVKVIG